MSTFRVKYAVVRPVPDSYDHCVRTKIEKIDVTLAKRQHAEYCKALQELGLGLVWVEGDNALADSCFVEDTALVFGGKGGNLQYEFGIANQGGSWSCQGVEDT